jgi:cell division transport system permease protein
VIALRPSGFDELGLRRALTDWMLPLLVAAMALLAALAVAGWFGSAALAQHWQQGAASLTVQVPQPSDPVTRSEPGRPVQKVADQNVADPKPSSPTRLAAVLALLTGTPGIASAHALSDQELTDLLKPWLGPAMDPVDGRQPGHLAIPIPAVIAVRLTDAATDLGPLSRRLAEVARGTVVEDHAVWIRRLAVLARSLQTCAGLALLLVAGVAAAVIAVATRAGLATRREAIEIVHGLGATDRYIASRFAARATFLAAVGATGGAIIALPVLLTLARMAAPFGGDTGPVGDTVADTLATLPLSLWLSLPILPLMAAAIGFTTAHGAVRRWLRRLP